MQSQRGYTLLELLAAVAISLLLASAALPAAVAWQNSNQVRSAAYALAGDLRFAQQRALLEGVPWQLVPLGSAGSYSGYTLYYQNTTGWVPYVLHAQTAINLPPPVQISAIAPGSSALNPMGNGTMDGIGFAPATGSPTVGTDLIFTLVGARAAQFQVKVRAVTGQVNVCSGTCP